MDKRKSFLIVVLFVFAIVAFATAFDNPHESRIPGSGNNTKAAAEAEEQSSSTVLVAYFSATGKTERVAKFLAASMNADLYKITPEKKYTRADLDYRDADSRIHKEEENKDLRPQIAGKVKNMDKYDIVFVGYPIWWGQEPRIIDTFVESYDFTGKAIIPFCTSRSSDIFDSSAHIREICNDSVIVQEGKRFNARTSRNDVITWVNAMEIGVKAK